MGYSHTTGYYSAIKKSKPLEHKTTQMSLKNIMLPERSQTQKSIYCCMIPFMCSPWRGQTNLWWQNMGSKWLPWEREMPGRGHEGNFYGDKNVSCLVLVEITVYKIIRTPWTGHLRYVHFIECYWNLTNKYKVALCFKT